MEYSRTFPEDSSFSLTEMFLFLQKKKYCLKISIFLQNIIHTYIHTYMSKLPRYYSSCKLGTWGDFTYPPIVSSSKFHLPTNVKQCLDFFPFVFSAPLPAWSKPVFQPVGSSAVEGTNQAELGSSDQRKVPTSLWLFLKSEKKSQLSFK